MKELWEKFANWVVITIGEIKWKYKGGMTEQELYEIKEMLKPNYYIILTHRKNHLSTFFVGFANFVVTGKWSYWAHALMNLEDEVHDPEDFRLVEATGKGTHYSTFDDVFEVHGVALLKPKNMTIEDWTFAMDRANSQLGKPYDSLFDLKNNNALSCVELVRDALMAAPRYYEDFKHFEESIVHAKNLTPQMFYDCDDFEVVYEVRRQ